MSRIYLICGKICSGKTYLARQMEKDSGAVRLSVDEEMLAMNPTGLFGEKHDEISKAIQKQLFAESVELIRNGKSVILDWGFWTKEMRREASAFYQRHAIPFEWHYIDLSDERWEKNIHQRNLAILAKEEVGFIVDDGLRQKLLGLFEAPSRDEIDVWNTITD